MSKNYLSKSGELHKGDSLTSNNKGWKAIFQEDGNLVIYGWEALWASNTNGSDVTRLCMEDDGNLVMYNNSDQPKWETHTSKSNCNTCRLHLTDEGKLVVSRENEEVWKSDTRKM